MTRMPQAHDETPSLPAQPHIAVQILGMLLFAGFAIVATVLAFVFFWPAGFVLAVILAWFGLSRMPGSRRSWQAADLSGPKAPQAPGARSGNSSFDAYRAEVLTRLEDEQKTFLRFLDRLRDAKDKSEFDSFMEDRARTNAARDAGAEAQRDPPAPPSPATGY